MRFLSDILGVFYPTICLSCNVVLTNQEEILCTQCLYDLPLTNFIQTNNTTVEKIFYGRIKIEQAIALLFYHKGGITQKLIHQLKYKGHEEIGVFIGDWLGNEIQKYHFFNDVDFIIPVPLHKNRLKKRGYNQVSKFGKRLEFHMNTPFVEDVLIRTTNSETQTKKTRFDRWKNVNELFFLSDCELFKNKHILLIDDIITTGATIESCVNELLKAKNIKISIAVMAFTE